MSATKASDLVTISEARLYLHDNRHTGSRCPCCSHYDQVYRRKITRAQVHFLRDLFLRSRQLHGIAGHFVDIRHIDGVRGGDYAKLALWDLVEASPTDVGLWRITPLGLTFLRGQARIPKYAYVYRGALDRYGSDMIDVHDANRERFDLTEALA
jgi:hypothetical protein